MLETILVVEQAVLGSIILEGNEVGDRGTRSGVIEEVEGIGRSPGSATCHFEFKEDPETRRECVLGVAWEYEQKADAQYNVDGERVKHGDEM